MPEKEKEKEKEKDVSNAEYAFWFFVFTIFSVGMTIVNKMLSTSIPLRNTVIVWQNAVAAAIVLSMSVVSGKGFWEIKPYTFPQIRRIMFVSLNFTLMLASNMQALPLIAISTLVVARNLAACIIAVGDYFIFGKTFSMQAIASLVVTVIGSLIYAKYDLTYNFEGYLWVGANQLFFIIGQLYEKWAMTKSADQTATGVATMKNLLSLPVGLVLTVSAGEHLQLADAVGRLSSTDWAGLIATAIGTALFGIIYMTLYKIASATAVSVGGNFNKVVSIVAGSFFFSAKLAPNQILGVIVCIVGSMWYSLASMKKPVVTPKEAAKDK